MEKHAVPQNIMDIEFKLFGSLTVKQFVYIAITFSLSLMLYFSGLHWLVTYPLIFFLVIIGLALAFVKVNEQPFAAWFSNFIASLFRSQRMIYKKTAKKSLLDTPSRPVTRPAVSKHTTELEVSKTKYLQRLRERNSSTFKTGGNSAVTVEEADVDKLEQVDDPLDAAKGMDLDRYFNNLAKQNLEKYNLKPAQEVTLAGDKFVPATTELMGGPANVTVQTLNNSNHRPLNRNTEVEDMRTRKPGNSQLRTVKVQADETESKPVVDDKSSPVADEEKVEGLAESVAVPAKETKQEEAKAQVDEPELKPESKDEELEPKPEPMAEPEPAVQEEPEQKLEQELEPKIEPIQEPEPEPAIQEEPVVPAEVNTPEPPPQNINVISKLLPNQIAGFLVDKNNNPVPQGRVIVKDSEGNMVRSVYADNKGKFVIPSALKNGDYQIELQVKGYNFPEYNLALTGEVVPMYRYVSQN